jgi:hypothetical protein
VAPIKKPPQDFSGGGFSQLTIVKEGTRSRAYLDERRLSAPELGSQKAPAAGAAWHVFLVSGFWNLVSVV